ncbi:hypothetical protein ACFL6M_05460 [Candidatus Eisenbacteria bacterium]|uniref:Uncharacterized protein n=1 Tax=Eiseniibacteriota bacterium TaxID=2212470 RepID=A0ABV6YL32_UNCEI
MAIKVFGPTGHLVRDLRGSGLAAGWPTIGWDGYHVAGSGSRYAHRVRSWSQATKRQKRPHAEVLPPEPTDPASPSWCGIGRRAGAAISGPHTLRRLRNLSWTAQAMDGALAGSACGPCTRDT